MESYSTFIEIVLLLYKPHIYINVRLLVHLIYKVDQCSANDILAESVIVDKAALCYTPLTQQHAGECIHTYRRMTYNDARAVF